MFNKKKDLNKNIKINKKKKGFTLVELVVVIAVIAILAGVSVAAYFGVTDSANKSNAETYLKEMKDNYTMYLIGNDNNQQYDSDVSLMKYNVDPLSNEETISENKELNNELKVLNFVDGYVKYCAENGLLEGKINSIILEERIYFFAYCEAYTPYFSIKYNLDTLVFENIDTSETINEGLNISFGVLKGDIGSVINEISTSTGDKDLDSENLTYEYNEESDSFDYLAEPVLVNFNCEDGKFSSFSLVSRVGKEISENEFRKEANLPYETRNYSLDSFEDSAFDEETGMYFETSNNLINVSGDMVVSFPIKIDDEDVDKETKSATYKFKLENNSIEDFTSVAYLIRNYSDVTIRKYESIFPDEIINSEDKGDILYNFDSLDAALKFSNGYKTTVTVEHYSVEDGDNCDPQKGELTSTEPPVVTTCEDFIYLTANATLTRDSTVSENTNLYLPLADNNIYKKINDSYKGSKKSLDLETASPRIKLTLNADLNVNGNLYTSGSFANFSSISSSTTAPLMELVDGQEFTTVTINEGCTLTINKSGNLENYGIIDGKGEVIVYGRFLDRFLIRDWRGGTSASESLNKYFPFNFYTMNGSKIAMKFYQGSKYDGFLSVSASGSWGYMYGISTLTIVGNNYNSGILNLNAGYYIKSLDENENLKIDLYGTLETTSKELKIPNPMGSENSTIDIDISNLGFSFSNIDLSVKNGSVFLISDCPLKVLPSSRIEIEEGGKMIVNSTFVNIQKEEFLNFYSTKNGFNSGHARNINEQFFFDSINLINNGEIIVNSGATFAAKVINNGLIKFNGNVNFENYLLDGFNGSKSKSEPIEFENEIQYSTQIDNPLKELNLPSSEYNLKLVSGNATIDEASGVVNYNGSGEVIIEVYLMCLP